MTFIIQKPRFDGQNNTAVFAFQNEEHSFTETLTFPKGGNFEVAQSEFFKELLNITACVLGTSYYKLLAPFDIQIPHFALTRLQQELVTDVYENGLGEFYARNNLRRFGKLNIQVETASSNSPPLKKQVPTSRPLLLVGGGKDSNVSAHLLARGGLQFTPFAVNPKGPIVSSVKAMAHQPLYVKRVLDPLMISLGQQTGFYNGHVPSTAINSMIATLSAALFDYNTIILSNERSASEANVQYDGREVNHQHSKSLAFEKLLQKTLNQTSRGTLEYFSLLRPLSELKIAQVFSETLDFDTQFSSCNTNFKQGDNTQIRWCNSCPKCHFVYLMFAPFMHPSRLQRIFGDNPLAHTQNQASFEALTGLKSQKPWECVGETMEAAAALYHLHNNTTTPAQPLVTSLARKLEAKYGEKKLIATWSELLINSSEHCLPYQFVQFLPDHQPR